MDPLFFERHLGRVEQFFLALADCLPEDSGNLCSRILEIVSQESKLTDSEKLTLLSNEIETTTKTIGDLKLLAQQSGDEPFIDHESLLQDLVDMVGGESFLAVCAASSEEQTARIQRVRILAFLIEAVGRKDAVPSRLLYLATRSADPDDNGELSSSPLAAQPCPSCHGTGNVRRKTPWADHHQPCTSCQGTGSGNPVEPDNDGPGFFILN